MTTNDENRLANTIVAEIQMDCRDFSLPIVIYADGDIHLPSHRFSVSDIPETIAKLQESIEKWREYERTQTQN